MSDFAALFAIVAEALDGAFGEPVQLVPQVDDASSEFVVVGADSGRPTVSLIGIFDDDTIVARPVGSGANTHDTVDVVTGSSMFDFAAALFPTDADLPLQRDVLVLTSRPGAPRYQIVSVQPDGLGRVICLATALS